MGGRGDEDVGNYLVCLDAPKEPDCSTCLYAPCHTSDPNLSCSSGLYQPRSGTKRDRREYSDESYDRDDPFEPSHPCHQGGWDLWEVWWPLTRCTGSSPMICAVRSRMAA